MFTPSDASRRATSEKPRAVTGRPRTTSTWVESRRPSANGSSPIAEPILTSTVMPTDAIACSTDSCRPSGSR